MLHQVLLLSLFPATPAFTTQHQTQDEAHPSPPRSDKAEHWVHPAEMPPPAVQEDMRGSEVPGKGGERRGASCPALLPGARGEGWRHLPAADGWREQVVKEKADTSQRLIVPVSSFMNGSQKVP